MMFWRFCSSSPYNYKFLLQRPNVWRLFYQLTFIFIERICICHPSRREIDDVDVFISYSRHEAGYMSLHKKLFGPTFHHWKITSRKAGNGATYFILHVYNAYPALLVLNVNQIITKHHVMLTIYFVICLIKTLTTLHVLSRMWRCPLLFLLVHHLTSTHSNFFNLVVF